MSLELQRGVSTYFLIHECCPWKKVWVNYRMQCPARPLCSLGTSQHSFDIPFFLCSSYPQTQWCSLTHSWLVLIFHFLCQVTVGCYFMFSSGGDCSLLFFQDLFFGNFPIHLVTMEVNVCPVGFSILLLLLLHLCGARSSRRGGECRGQGKPSPSDSKAHPSPPSKALNEEKLQVCRQIPSGHSYIPLNS